MFTGYNNKKRVNERYKIVGFISSGTYGRVYKAEGKNGRTGEFAIKKCVEVPCSFAFKLTSAGSSQTRKASCSTPASRSQPYEKWLSAPS
jgi:hypothetical protein